MFWLTTEVDLDMFSKFGQIVPHETAPGTGRRISDSPTPIFHFATLPKLPPYRGGGELEFESGGTWAQKWGGSCTFDSGFGGIGATVSGTLR